MTIYESNRVNEEIFTYQQIHCEKETFEENS